MVVQAAAKWRGNHDMLRQHPHMNSRELSFCSDGRSRPDPCAELKASRRCSSTGRQYKRRISSGSSLADAPCAAWAHQNRAMQRHREADRDCIHVLGMLVRVLQRDEHKCSYLRIREDLSKLASYTEGDTSRVPRHSGLCGQTPAFSTSSTSGTRIACREGTACNT